MGKLYFYYGTMGAGKTALAISKAYEFINHFHEVKVCVPSIVDDKKLESRNGSSIDVNIVIDFDTLSESKMFLEKFDLEKVEMLIIDEAQFLTALQVQTLRKLADEKDILVFCFGLLTDYKLNLFEGSKNLIVYAHSFREIPSMCEGKNCRQKAQYNIRTSRDKGQIVLSKRCYQSLCLNCYEKKNHY